MHVPPPPDVSAVWFGGVTDSVRLVVLCAIDQEKCSFMDCASWMSTEKSFQVKKINDRHICVRSFSSSRLMNPTWLAKQFVKELVKKPKLKCKETKTIIQSKFHCKVSWSKCYRSMCRALSLIHGKLSDHCARAINFHKTYVWFKSIKEGCKIGCYWGEILTVIGRDVNNQIYPIAWDNEVRVEVKSDIKFMRESNYTTEEILDYLGINEEELYKFESLKQVHVELDISHSFGFPSQITIEIVFESQKSGVEVMDQEGIGEEDMDQHDMGEDGMDQHDMGLEVMDHECMDQEHMNEDGINAEGMGV
uniref:Transposase MuDR plant domain-containing protein n=1 Tax=Lactuca sativa TaxID=4236 RepID=A0A9R1VV64_LACSA|nr:hypothetical protein LSAT_V11C400176320 [Lactuca sativa]